MGIRVITQVILGHLASSLWFFPPLCKWLHEVRGIKFAERVSVFIGRNVLLDNRNPELISIGPDVWLTYGVTILSHSWCSDYQRNSLKMDDSSSAVTICEGTFIGANTTILPGVTLGRGCYIGAGSVVTCSIAPGMLAAGNPCREIRPIFHQKT